MSARRRLLLRVAATLAALALFAWLTPTSPASVLDALGRLSLPTLIAAGSLGFANFAVGAVRWRALFSAFGATEVPAVGRLMRLHLEGAFFNTFLPANVGGDVLRAAVTRRSFDHASGAFLVVGLERVFGLAGLFTLAGALQLVRPVAGAAHAGWLGALGLAGGLVSLCLAAGAKRIGGALPGRAGALLARLPELRRPARLLPVAGLSLVTHGLVAATGTLLLSELAPGLSPWDAMVLVPLAMAATYAPTLAGLGAREAAFVLLLGLAHATPDEATAASLGMLAVQLVLASVGGALHLFWPAARAAGDVVD